MLNYNDALGLASLVASVILGSSDIGVAEEYKPLFIGGLVVVFIASTSINAIKRGFLTDDTKQAIINLVLIAIDIFETKRIKAKQGDIPNGVEETVHRILLNGFDLSEWEIVQDENDHAILRRKPTAEVPTL